MTLTKYILTSLMASAVLATFHACKPKGAGAAVSGDAAEKVYVCLLYTSPSPRD